MLIKNIIKRGIKDTTWINDFLSKKLEGKESTIINATEKMYNNIFYKYGRVIDVKISRLRKSNCGIYNSTSILFLNDNYAFEVLEDKNGKYGRYFTVRIIDIEKDKNAKLMNHMNNVKKNLTKDMNKDFINKYQFDLLYSMYKDYWTKRLNAEYNPFSCEISNNNIFNKIDKYEYESIMDNIEELEDEFEIF